MKSSSFSGGNRPDNRGKRSDNRGGKEFDDIMTAHQQSTTIDVENEDSIKKSFLSHDFLHRAAYTEDSEAFESLLNQANELIQKVDNPTFHEHVLRLYINAPDEKGRTALHYLAMRKNTPMIEILNKYARKHCEDKGIDRCSFLDLTALDSFGGTPLHYAASTYKYLPQKLQINLDIEEMDNTFENIFTEALKGEDEDCLTTIIGMYKQEWHNTKRKKQSLDNAESFVDFFIQSVGGNPLHWTNNDPVVILKILTQICTETQQQKEENITKDFKTFRKFARKHLKLLLHLRDENGNTLLHLSSNHDDSNLTFLLLLQLGADPLCQNNYGETVLHLAALDGNMLIVDELTKDGGERSRDLVFVTDGKLQTALHKSMLRNNLRITKHLLGLGLKELVYMADMMGYYAFHYATAASSADVMECICSNMSDVNYASSAGHTVMHGSARLNNVTLIQWMLNSNRGFDVNARTNEMMTPLLTAAHFSSVQSFVLLYQHPTTDILAENNKYMNSLHIAILAQSYEIVQFLVSKEECGTYINNMTVNGETAFVMAANSQQYNILHLLLTSQIHNLKRRTKEISHLHLTAKKARTADLELFLSGSSPHLFDESKSTPLLEATKAGNIANVTLLLKVGVYVDERDRDGFTSLGYCCKYDSVDIAVVLVKHGSSIEALDGKSMSPLQIACENESPAMVKFLIGRGANVSYKGDENKNALEIGTEYKNKECVNEIIRSDKWKVAMRSFHYDEITNTVSTPMRSLLSKLPDSALLVMDRCISTPRDEDSDGEEYHVEMDMEFLDDSYTSATWGTMGEFGEMALAIPTNPCFNEEGFLHKGMKPYNSSSKILHDNHPLNALTKQKELKLLEHPLVRELTNYKWCKFGRLLYYSSYFINILYVVCLTIFILETTLPQSVIPNYTDNCYYLPNDRKKCLTRESIGQSKGYIVVQIIFLLLASISIIREVLQFKNMKFKYFLQVDNLVEMVGYVCVMLAYIPDPFTRNSGILNQWQWELLSVGLICGYLMIALESRKLPIFGIYIIMVGDIIRSFAKAFLILSVICIGFGLFFYMIFGNEVPYTTWYLSLVKIIVMMVGEMDYEGSFFLDLGNRTDSEYLNTSMSNYPYLKYLGFLGFIFLGPIIIMNLLIGLAVDDIKSVMENAKMKKLMKRMDMSLSVEYLLFQRITRRFQKSVYELHPLQTKGKLWSLRTLIFPEVRSIFGSIKERKESVEAEKQREARKKASTDVLLNKLDEIKQQNVQIEQRLKRLEQHNN